MLRTSWTFLAVKPGFIEHDSVCAEDVFARVAVIYSSARVYGLSGPLKYYTLSYQFCTFSSNYML